MGNKYHLRLVSVLIFYCAFILIGFAAPDNIAGNATVSTSSSLSPEYEPDNLVDGVIGVKGKGNWACQGKTVFWGYIDYPWVQLDWPSAQMVQKVILYDLPSLDEHTAGGTLQFSDGSQVVVTAIPNDGTAKLIEFTPREVQWIRFTVTDGDGKNLGLSEIEVFPLESEGQDLVSWVNPFIETTRGRYFFFTPGSTPFGMIAAAPHTRIKNQWGGGYNYNSMNILGFGQLHGWMLSGLEIMPASGTVNPVNGREAWKSSFSHDDEIAQPGYHRVFLRTPGVWTENTTTDRVSMYRFRYTDGGEQQIIVNLGGYCGSTTMIKADAKRVSNRELEGSFVSAGRMWGGPLEVKVFFVIEFDQPFDRLDGWSDASVFENTDGIKGPAGMQRMDSMNYGGVTQSYFSAPFAGLQARYHMEPGSELKMKIGISYTSIEQARKNLKAECDHWNFEQVRSTSRATWNHLLSRIEVQGGTRPQKIKFYTDLWHVLLGRQIIDDISGSYPDYTEGELDWKFTDAPLKIRQLPTKSDGSVVHHMYTSDALWLTQWNVNVLWGLGWPSVLDDFSASMVQYADNGGLLPRGPCMGGYSYIMTGCPATSMIVSAFQKGMLTKTDPGHALDVISRNHLPGGMMGDSARLQFYIDHGWCPGNAGETLEWTFQDWAAAQMARKLGQVERYQTFLQRAEGWQHLFDQETGLIYPKDEAGNWLHREPLSGEGWIEANAWQGTWSISHAISTLIEHMGGSKTFCDKLNYAFEQSVENDFVFGYGAGYVSYANQPGCSNAHVFNHAGKPWLSQYWVRQVNEQAYGGITPDRGYGGHDEDQGQMGGVSALMSIGLFSLRGNTSSTPIYELTSPVFDEVVIHLDPDYYEGETFTIRTYNNSSENHYIQRARFNGNPLSRVWLTHEDFGRGGLLELWLGAAPNKQWGIEPFPDQE